MKTIKIMIAASEEMHKEKLEFTNLIEHLNEVLEPRGFELKRIKWNPETDGTIEEYKSKLKECEMCLTLYWRDLSGNSGQELDTAYQELKDGNNPRNLYVFFKEPTEDLTDALRDFKANFVTKYGHFFCKFENVDTMNLHFILQFEAYQNHSQDEMVNVANGKVYYGGKEMVNLDNVPFTTQNKDYQNYKQELLNIDREIQELETRITHEPNNKDLLDELDEKNEKRKEISERFNQYQNHLYSLAYGFAKLERDYYTERLAMALEQFEKGNISEANRILDLPLLKTEADHQLNNFDEYKKNLQVKITEFTTKAELLLIYNEDSNWVLSWKNVYYAIESYDYAINIAKQINLEQKDMAVLLCKYADSLDMINQPSLNYDFYLQYDELEEGEEELYNSFLHDYGLENSDHFKTRIITLYKTAIEIFREESEKKPDIYIPYLADTIVKLAEYQEMESAILAKLEAFEMYRNYSNQTASILAKQAKLLTWFAEKDPATDITNAYEEAINIYHKIVNSGSIYTGEMTQCLLSAIYYYYQAADYDKGDKYCSEVQKLNENENDSFKDVLSELALKFERLNLLDKAEEMYNKLWDMEKAANDRLCYSFSYRNLAEIHMKQGKYEQALSEYMNILSDELSIYKMDLRLNSKYSKDIESTKLWFLSDIMPKYEAIGNALMNLNKFEKAEKYYLNAIKIYKIIQSKGHPQTISYEIITKLGNLYLSTKREKEAIGLYDTAISLIKFGEYVFSSQYSGILELLQGVKKIANDSTYLLVKEKFNNCLKAWIKQINTVAIFKVNAIDLWLKLDEEELASQWLELCKEDLPTNTEDVVREFFNTGLHNSRTNDFKEIALKEYRHLLTICTQYNNSGIYDELIVNVRNSIEVLLYEKAAKLFNKAIYNLDDENTVIQLKEVENICRSTDLDNTAYKEDFQILSFKNSLVLGKLYASKMDYETAREELKNVLGIIQQLPDQKAYLSHKADALNTLSYIIEEDNDEKALDMYQEILAIYKQLEEDDADQYRPEVATTLYRIALVQETLSLYDEAINSYEECLALYEKCKEHQIDTILDNEIFNILYSIIEINCNQNKYDEAMAVYKKAISLSEKEQVDCDIIESIKQYYPTILTNLVRQHQKEGTLTDDEALEYFQLMESCERPKGFINLLKYYCQIGFTKLFKHVYIRFIE